MTLEEETLVLPKARMLISPRTSFKTLAGKWK